MIKSKKKLLPILSLAVGLTALGLGSVSFTGATPAVEAYAEAQPKSVKAVNMVEFEQFNIYSEDSSHIEMGEAKFGMLLRFDDVLSDDRTEINGGIKAKNLLAEYGKNILVNDMPIDFYTGAEISYFCEGYLWVFVPSIDSYRKISVSESFQFEDRIIQPFAIYSSINTDWGFAFTEWGNSAEAYLKTKTQKLEYKTITFNNEGYKYFSPKNGLLLEFDKKKENGEWARANISNTITEKDGGWMRTNLLTWNKETGKNDQHGAIQNDFLGAGASVGENVFLDGIPFTEIEGAEITYHSERFLWLYAPNMIDYSTVEIREFDENGTLFLDSYLSAVKLYSNGSMWMEYDPDASRADTTGVESVSYEKIEWNNADFGYRKGLNGVLLRFSDNLSKLQNELDGGIRMMNKVKTSIGEHVKLNGTPLNAIDGAEISYHSEQFLWVFIPQAYLSLDGGFPCLTIDGDTEFLNAILPAVSLYFDGSYWQEQLPSADDYGQTAFTNVMHNNVTIDGNEGYAYTVLLFEDDFTAASQSRPNFAQVGDSGVKIAINGKSLNALYMEDKNVRCGYVEGYGANAIQLILRKADLSPTAEYPVPTLTIENGTCFMDKTLASLTLYLVDGKWSETSAPSTPVEVDKTAPYLYYYGETEYQVLSGDSVMDFTVNALAFDEVDGEVAVSAEFPAGGVTDGKWNRGTWEVKLVASDAQGNKTEKVILVTAIDEEERYLSVYVNGYFSYRVRYGDKIRKDKSEELHAGDPKKADSATSYFVFTGWTFKGEKWDFENDVVTEDVYLSPTYREYKRLCTLTIKDEAGIVETLTVKYGDVIDLATYQKAGYNVLGKVDGATVARVAVNNDLTVVLQYTPIEEISNSAQATIILIACWAATAVLGVAGLALYKKLGKKAGKNQ